MRVVSSCELSYCLICFFQAEDGIRDLVRSRGLGDVYKRQLQAITRLQAPHQDRLHDALGPDRLGQLVQGAFVLSLIHI